MEEGLDLATLIDQVGRERSIDRDTLVDIVEQAILSAAKRKLGQRRKLEAEFNQESNCVDLFCYFDVVETVEDLESQISLAQARQVDPDVEIGDEFAVQVFYREQDREKAKEVNKAMGLVIDLDMEKNAFGRIQAQMAGQFIRQRVADANAENVYNEYRDRVGELVTGIARRFERGNIIVDLGRTEAILPVREQAPHENYRPGDRVQAFFKDILRSSRGPQIVLSRTHPGLVAKLFEVEVPEIYEGIVKIETVAREPGARAKIAVSSKDPDVDPVGACVGMKGSRVQNVVQELRGEKIDIVPFEADVARFVCNALSPAEVSKVIIDEEAKTMEIVVADDQLSLAIGKKGQNVRLASKLTGWRLDITSESKIQAQTAKARRELGRIEGISSMALELLLQQGYRSLQEIVAAGVGELKHVPGMDEAQAEAYIRSAIEKIKEGPLPEEPAPEPLPKKSAGPAGELDGVHASLSAKVQAVESSERLAQQVKGSLVLMELRGVGLKTIDQLSKGGYSTIQQLANADLKHLAESTEIGEKKAMQLITEAKNFLSGKKSEE